MRRMLISPGKGDLTTQQDKDCGRKCHVEKRGYRNWRRDHGGCRTGRCLDDLGLGEHCRWPTGSGWCGRRLRQEVPCGRMGDLSDRGGPFSARLEQVPTPSRKRRRGEIPAERRGIADTQPRQRRGVVARKGDRRPHCFRIRYRFGTYGVQPQARVTHGSARRGAASQQHAAVCGGEFLQEEIAMRPRGHLYPE